METEETIINAKWYAELVAERQSWIEHTKHQIQWHKDQVTENIEHLKIEEDWLKEALEQQKEYLREHP